MEKLLNQVISRATKNLSAFFTAYETSTKISYHEGIPSY